MTSTEKLTHAIISANHTEFWLRQINSKQAEKNLLKRTIKALHPYVLMSDDINEKADKPFEDVYNEHIEMLEEISKVKLYESSEITAIIRAYKKDPKSILGLTKKILR